MLTCIPIAMALVVMLLLPALGWESKREREKERKREREKERKYEIKKGICRKN